MQNAEQLTVPAVPVFFQTAENSSEPPAWRPSLEVIDSQSTSSWSAYQAKLVVPGVHTSCTVVPPRAVTRMRPPTPAPLTLSRA